MEHDPKRLQAVVEQAAPSDLPMTFRPMFGGIMGYAEGRPFVSLSNVGLALKLFGTDHTALLAQPDAAALRYEPDQPASKSYVVVPDAMLSDPALLRPWTVIANTIFFGALNNAVVGVEQIPESLYRSARSNGARA